MNARALIEAESPKRVFSKVATRQNRIAGMGFKSKDEVNIGTTILYRMTDYGFKGDVWDKANDEYYALSGSDQFRVSAWWRCPPGRKFDPGWTAHQCKKEEATHLSASGVCGVHFTWDEFFAKCLKPELYYPKRKSNRLAFEVPPDQRD